MLKPIGSTEASLRSENITIKAFRADDGVLHFRPGPQVALAADRFNELQKAFLAQTIPLAGQSRLIASLVLFDGICTGSDLKKAVVAMADAYWLQGSVALEWTSEDGRINRRTLSPFTVREMCLPQVGRHAVETVLTQLNEELARCVSSPKAPYTLATFLKDAQAWLFRILPGPLFGHVSNHAPLAGLPRSCWSRLASLKALARGGDETGKLVEPGFADALGGFVSPIGSDLSGSFVQEIVLSCRRQKSSSSAKNKELILRSLLALSARASQAGPLSSLILAWAIDLIESGTRRRPNLAVVTPVAYIRAAAPLLFDVLRERNLVEMEARGYFTIYQRLMDGRSASGKRRLASALSSWHYFLTCWTDVAPLNASLHRLIPLSPPKANLLWPHEVERIRDWLKSQKTADRFLSQVDAAFELLNAVRIRANELLHLKLRDVVIHENYVEVGIATSEKDGGLKTVASRRSASIADPVALIALRDWIERRFAEDALSESDYVFGDPYAPGRLHRAGEMYLFINTLLKASTGDPSIGTHALSHTRVSFDFNQLKESPADMNWFDQESANVGHQSAATSFAHYFHVFERWLRFVLDQAIFSRFCSMQTMSDYVGIHPAAFRKALSRQVRKEPLTEKKAYLQSLVEQACPHPLCPSVETGTQVGEATMPSLVRGNTVSVMDALNLIHDIQSGYRAEEIRLRAGRSLSWVRDFARSGLDVLITMKEISAEFTERYPNDPVSALQAALSGECAKRIQARRVQQHKSEWLLLAVQDLNNQSWAEHGIDSWLKCYRRGYVSLDVPERASAFIDLLDQSKLPRDYWRIRSYWDDRDPRFLALRQLLRAGGASVSVSPIKARRGRPGAYLVLSSSPVSGGMHRVERSLASAEVAMTGANTLMYAAAVRRRITSPRASDVAATAKRFEGGRQ